MPKEWIVPDADLGCDGAYFDYQEVVRCKDCKYKVVTDDGEWYELDVVCSYWETDGLTADDYCSYGERGIYKPDAD